MVTAVYRHKRYGLHMTTPLDNFQNGHDRSRMRGEYCVVRPSSAQCVLSYVTLSGAFSLRTGKL